MIYSNYFLKRSYKPLEPAPQQSKPSWSDVAGNVVAIALLTLGILGIIGACVAASICASPLLPGVAVVTGVLGYMAISMICIQIYEIRKHFKPKEQ